MRSIIEQIPPKVGVWLICTVVGLPSSLLGWQWVEMKLAKQQADCYTDLALNVSNGKGVTPGQQLSAIQDSMEAYKKCQSGVDPKKGSLAFLKEQGTRLKEGKM